MGYSNSFKLKVEGKITKQVKTTESCGSDVTELKCAMSTFSPFIRYTEDLTQNFCNKCGVKLVQKEIEVEASEDIIKEFVKTYKDGDAGYLLDKYGYTRESGSGYGINGELKEFSMKYPNLTFILSCQWESELVEEGQPGTDYFFFKNGVEKKAESKVVYVNPFTKVEF